MPNRFFPTIPHSNPTDLDEKERAGRYGEDYAACVLNKIPGVCYVRNPIIPQARKPGLFNETDFLAYHHGNLYCLEIKYYRGRIYYPPAYTTIWVKKGWFIFKRLVPQFVPSGYNYAQMVQESTDASGQRNTRTFPNPWKKTDEYIHNLKYYLQQVHPGLTQFPIYPILAFSHKADLSAVHRFDAGILYIDEIAAFLDKYAHSAYARQPAPWIEGELRRLPTWDYVFTIDGKSFNGMLSEPALRFKDAHWREQVIPYRTISALEIQTKQEIKITSIDGRIQTFNYKDGAVRLNRFKGEQQIHSFDNIRQVIVGVANRFR
ncbi:MAG: NERD domain-containing protein [Chloroflexota bacterium]|nr:NERD domain-containing protein [Chloroflexota bacterium]